MTRGRGPDKATRELVIQRDITCVMCDQRGEQIHHRRPRGMGGTSRPDAHNPSVLVLLCRACHAHVESHRTDALDRGLLLPQSCIHTNAAPLTWHNRTVLLHDDGSVTDVTPDWTN